MGDSGLYPSKNFEYDILLKVKDGKYFLENIFWKPFSGNYFLENSFWRNAVFHNPGGRAGPARAGPGQEARTLCSELARRFVVGPFTPEIPEFIFVCLVAGPGRRTAGRCARWMFASAEKNSW